jgi:hypothetical protein
MKEISYRVNLKGLGYSVESVVVTGFIEADYGHNTPPQFRGMPVLRFENLYIENNGEPISEAEINMISETAKRKAMSQFFYETNISFEPEINVERIS